MCFTPEPGWTIDYIETFYNPVRIHQTLGDLSPNQYEAENAPATAA